MKGTILVVDDEPAMQWTLAAMLEDEGYAVICAANGREALAHLEREGFAPRLILLDITMPAMDGYAFAEELNRRGLPVVVISADGRAAEKAARVSAEGYLAKPFGLAALIETVERLARPEAG